MVLIAYFLSALQNSDRVVCNAECSKLKQPIYYFANSINVGPELLFCFMNSINICSLLLKFRDKLSAHWVGMAPTS